MKNILITGANGFLGHHLSQYLKKLDFNVYGIDKQVKLEDANESIFTHYISDTISLKNIASFNTIFDIIIHCAGSPTVGYSINNPLLDFENNVTTTCNILEYVRTVNPFAKVIFISTAAVYGLTEKMPVTENSLLNPVSPYGITKKMAEEICFSYSKNYNIKIAIIRFFSIYGEGLRKQLLWDACNKFDSKEDKIIFNGNGDEIRDWIYIQDAIKLIFTISNLDFNFEIFNGGSGIPISIKYVLGEMSLYFENKKFMFNHIIKAGDPEYYCADIKKTIATGWKPEESINNGIAKYVEWYKKQNN